MDNENIEAALLSPTSTADNCDSPSTLYDLIENFYTTELANLTPPAVRPDTFIINEPEMCLTTEENNFIAELKSKHSSACKRSFPLRSGHEARHGMNLSQIGLF